MTTLLRFEVIRLIRQKFIYFFLATFVLAVLAYSFLLTTPDMYELMNIDPAEASGADFPEFMVRFFAITVGPLFMAFISSLYINEEKQIDMLKQPLMHGKSRNDILHSKMIALIGVNIVIMATIFVLTYVISYIKWGNIVFAREQIIITLQKYLLLTLNLITIQMLIILVCLYALNSIIVIGITFLVIMVDGILCTQFVKIAEIISFNYSTYYLLLEAKEMDAFIALKSICYDALFFYAFYIIALKRINKMDISY